MVLYVAADLLWATRIKSSAEALGTPCRPVRSVEMLDARLVDSPVKTVLLDLETDELAFAVLERACAWNEDHPEAPIETIAWGPHVQVEDLQRARARGCSRVLTRGQFSAELPAILQAHAE